MNSYITKCATIVLTLSTLSGIVYAAQKNNSFWNRLAHLCCKTSQPAEPRIIHVQQDNPDVPAIRTKPYSDTYLKPHIPLPAARAGLYAVEEEAEEV